MTTALGPRFSHFFMSTADPVWTVDDAFRAYAALADIHDVVMDDAINEDFSDLDDFTASGDDGTWSVSDNVLNLTYAPGDGTDPKYLMHYTI